jgi:hypothetical protein
MATSTAQHPGKALGARRAQQFVIHQLERYITA